MSDDLQDPNEATVLVIDLTTNAPTSIPVAQYRTAIASGRYRPYEQSVVRTNRGGATVVNAPDDAAAHIAAGESFESGHAEAQEALKQRQRDAFDNIGDKVFTVLEGVADVATFGVVREHGEQADIRRDVNAGSAFAGQLAGYGLALATNPTSALGKLAATLPVTKLARGSEKAGHAVAKKLFGEAAKGDRVATAVGRRAVAEAVPNAALAGAAALGHGVTDALIEDKPFAAETIASAMGSDFMIGAGFGGAAQLFKAARGSVRARDAIRQQSGLLDPTSVESKAVKGAVGEAVSGLHQAMEHRRAAFGALKAMDEAGELGHVGPDALRVHRKLLGEAEGYAKRLAKMSPDVLDGDNVRLADKYLELLEGYSASVAKLDDAVRALPREVADGLRARSGGTTPGLGPSKPPGPGVQRLTPVEVGQWVDNAPKDPTGMLDRQFREAGQVPGDAAMLDEMMTPELRAKYRELHGRDYEPMAPREAPSAGAENLGGKASATAELSTNPGSRPRRAPEAPVVEDPTGVGGPATAVDDLSGLKPQRAQSSLEGFAYDVQAAASRLRQSAPRHAEKGGRRAAVDLPDAVGLEDVFNSLKNSKGKPPMAFERFRELVAEAQQAGYLSTTGKTGNVPHAGDVGDALRVPDDFKAGDPVKYQFGARFGRWEDKGRWGNDTVPGANVEEHFQHGPNAPPREAPPESVTGDEYPTPVNGPQKTQVLNGKTVVDRSNEGALAKALRESEVPPTPAGPDLSGRPPSALADGRLDEYLAPFDSGPVTTAGDKAAAKIRESIEQLAELTNGRINSSLAPEAAEAAGLPNRARGELGNVVAQIIGLRQLARAAAESAPGTGKKGRLFGSLVRRMSGSGTRAGFQGRSVGGAAVGAAIGVIGGGVGEAVIGGIIGSGGGLAGSVGRARDAVIKAGDALLSGRRSRVAAAIPRSARYSYDGSEPTEDVAERVQQLQAVVANPDGIRQRVREALGDLAVMQPELAEAAAETQVRRLTNLSVRAPMMVWNQMGEPRPAGAQALRQFREYEDATWNVESVLRAASNGYVTRAQADAFREQHPQHHSVFVAHVLSDRGRVRTLVRERRAALELLTGLPLTRATPEYVARQQAGFAPPQPAAPPSGGGPTAPPPTPAQAGNTAPGN